LANQGLTLDLEQDVPEQLVALRLYEMELLGWRELRNRREVGALVGLTPTPNESGQ